MTNKINITIPQPCHENWDAMTAVDKGRFCALCQKKVHDFTKSSDREIVTAYERDQNLCGRFLHTQLDRDLMKPNEKNSVWLATSAAMLSLIGFGAQEAVAQTTAQTEQSHYVVGKRIATPTQFEVSGIVSDDSGPIPGANVTIAGTSNSTQTDVDGQYTIKVTRDDALIFSFIGMETLKIPVGDKTVISPIIKANKGVVLGEPAVIFKSKNHSKQKQGTFFGRLFHGIGDWFR